MNHRILPLTPLLAVLAVSSAVPAAAVTTEDGVPVAKVIESFVDKETEFTRARESYTYQQSVKVLEYDNSGGVRGRWEMVQKILFGVDGKRIEKVLYSPVSTLRNILLTHNDMNDLRSVQPFVMTRATSSEYRIDYLGDQLVDEIDTHMFSVKPKKLVKGKRYFEGQVWVDKLGLQIVKTYGKGVGLLKGSNKDERFPRFETYRDQIDGSYWFPVYTFADDTLNFPSGPQRIRMIIKYDNYKRFEGQSTITFGEVVEGQNEGAQP